MGLRLSVHAERVFGRSPLDSGRPCGSNEKWLDPFPDQVLELVQGHCVSDISLVRLLVVQPQSLLFLVWLSRLFLAILRFLPLLLLLLPLVPRSSSASSFLCFYFYHPVQFHYNNHYFFVSSLHVNGIVKEP